MQHWCINKEKEGCNCCDFCLGLLAAVCLLGAQLNVKKTRRAAVASCGGRLVLCWTLLQLLVVSAVKYSLQFHGIRQHLFARFQLDPKTWFSNKETQLNWYLKNPLHKLVIPTTSFFFCSNLAVGLSVFYVSSALGLSTLNHEFCHSFAWNWHVLHMKESRTVYAAPSVWTDISKNCMSFFKSNAKGKFLYWLFSITVPCMYFSVQN